MEQESLYKLTKLKDFEELKKNGNKVVGKFYFFVCLPSGHKAFAPVVSKKNGNAVKRNYEKRVIRALAQRHFGQLDSVKCLIIRIPRREGSFLEKNQDFQNSILKIKRMSQGCGH